MISVVVLFAGVRSVRGLLVPAVRGFAKKKRVVTQMPSSPAGFAASPPPPPLPSGVDSVSLETEMSESFMRYALSTLLGRALPDVRDGLKPVHRRILFGMRDLGLVPRSQYRKCARVVGEVLGKYHPHGDASVYEALVRMAQDFVMSERLIDGHGNFGSVDADPAAAMRYTECKLTRFAFEALLNPQDLSVSEELCVPLVKNFDGSESEARVLPSRVPLLLVNGASGIAVGMATNIPPHNLGEVCDATLALATARKKGEKLKLEKLRSFLPAPDFPTGGLIMGLDGVASAYATGQGSVVVRARTHLETTKKGRPVIVATELPYQVPKAELLAKTASLVDQKKLEGIADLRDESGRDGMRVVYELKKDANPELVRAALFQNTRLQTSFAANVVAVDADGRQPAKMTLERILDAWLAFRFECVRRRAERNEREKARRMHVVEGLQIARDNADALLQVLRTSQTPADAKAALTSKNPPLSGRRLSDAQADSVLRLQLSRLTNLEGAKLDDEHAALEAEVKSLRELLTVDAAVYDEIIREVEAVKAEFSRPRRTEIVADAILGAREEDVIENSRSAILVSRDGYIKRVPLDEFRAQARGGRGKSAAASRTRLDHVLSCHDHDTLLCIASTGVAYGVRAFKLSASTRQAKGVPLPRVIPGIQAKPRLSGVVAVSSAPEHHKNYLVILTRKGLIKKTPLDVFTESMSARGLIALTLNDGDAVGWVKLCGDDDTIIVASKSGQFARFSTTQLTPTSRKTRGVRAMKLKHDDDEIVAMDVCDNTDAHEHALVLTAAGYGKRLNIRDLKITKRGTMGMQISKFKTDDDSLAGLCCCRPGDEVVISTKRGLIVRTRADTISIQGRAATGVLVQRPNSPTSPEQQTVNGDDKVAQVSVVPPDLLDLDDD
ncbi:hypothetical protein CTAYLR_008016 [Chrysophaeum taylorii]|uniref:DNA topoisomerase (ATP-hydrolyzing) n=1 Tax=Chrysophaeum taylorii TaxID=2483200 RepID=A0AAD7UCS2_9STRA|nr:hypothetical protein CTAYLR_008016 [Chrysophaeum taylorii]